jgi:surface antigen
MKALAVIGLAGLLVLSGCDNMGPKQTGGAVIGGAGGALAGAQFGGGKGRLVTTAIGTLLGAAIGSSVGASLDELDEMKANQAFNKAAAAPVGQSIAWNNPKSGHSGTVVATRDGTSTTGAYCREFQNTVTIGGQPQSSYGTACRQPDGTWKIVN